MLFVTVEPLYYGHFGTLILVLITEVSSIQTSFNTLQYYFGTQNSVLITEVFGIQRFVIEWFHCICEWCTVLVNTVCVLIIVIHNTSQ